MESSLIYSDVINRVGYTVIDGVKIVQYSCLIPLDNPQGMRISMTKMNADLYKANRDVCRADFAKFEDAAYELQEAYISKTSV